ncbi:glycerophosphodiester phosphodiesterase family protein [Sphingobacterium sp. JB170]|uniref:glycerophosphodiester phosphodiesterase family protein n=1 Tax=Sphingobacterium sp. JB170 TaxID=1434842 RepID=UPI00097F5FAB|nr:glycerophosphodiester phosphodiesterase family protein [Sphingobacterium sp. JB170]SJN47692.1 Glycerophosphoryl diester phosphodiesterase [Sphingobacterium sp. JB170]
MKKNSTVCSLLFVFFLGVCTPAFSQLDAKRSHAQIVRAELFNENSNKVFVVAHRADWRNFPENSIGAIRSAIAMGVDVLELDVQRSKDGVLLLMHDATVNRTTSGNGKVADMDYAALEMLRLKNGAGRVTSEHIPTLEETLLEIKGKVLVNLDKADRYFDEIYPMLQRTGTLDHIIMKGNGDAKTVSEKFGRYLKDVLYMPIVNIDKQGAFDEILSLDEQLAPVAFELTYKDTTHAAALKVRPLLANKSLIWYNSLWASLSGGLEDDRAVGNPAKIYGYLIDKLGARIIQTDRPALLIDYLKSKGLYEIKDPVN